MVVIDTDVLLLAFAFQNDKHQPANAAFLKRVQTADPAITVYNLMELLAIILQPLTCPAGCLAILAHRSVPVDGDLAPWP